MAERGGRMAMYGWVIIMLNMQPKCYGHEVGGLS